MQMPEKTVTVGIPRFRTPTVRAGALVALGLAAFLVAWFAVGHGNGSKPHAVAGAVAASENDLKELAGSLDHPIYWAGAKSNTTYELTRTPDGRVYIRYLPSAAKLGDPHPNYLTVGTYPRTRAFAELRRAARQKGAVRLKLGASGLVYYSAARPTNVYFGYPHARYQVEVYDPSPNQARHLVLARQIKPIK
jgi:hypothetical protein